MVDKIKPLKFETSIDGTEVDYLPSEANATEDYVSAKGVAFENSDVYLAHKVGKVLKFKTPDGSQKITYSAGDVSYIEFFESSTQTTGNRKAKVSLTYSSGDPTVEAWEIYDSDGTTVLQTITYTHTYSDGDLVTTVEATT